MSLRGGSSDFPLWSDTIFLPKFVLCTPVGQRHFIALLEQGPPSASPPARASCDPGKATGHKPRAPAPQHRLRAQLPDELAEGCRQLSSSGDEPPPLSHSPGRPHSTPLKGLEGREQRTAQAELLTFSAWMLFFRPAL